MSWVSVCTVDQLTNGPIVFRHQRLQIAVYQTAKGLYAIDNRCPHEGYPLAEGTVDDNCVITCNWHNWKFRLADGDCILGGDHVRAYQVRQEGEQILIDLSPPPADITERRILDGLKVAFQKQEYGRICREISRLHFSGLDPLIAVQHGLNWSYDKFEYGTTHAFAACADWLTLYNHYKGQWDKQLVCLAETVNHMAFDALRHPEYPHFAEDIPWNGVAFCEGIEDEDRASVESMMLTASHAEQPLKTCERELTQSALAHYNDFGHSLIYVQKARELLQHLGSVYAPQIFIPLARHLCYTTREDLIPEFSEYRPALNSCAESFGTETLIDDLTGLQSGGISGALQWTAQATYRYTANSIYHSLLHICAENLLLFDLNNEARVNNSVADNVGWLGFTHAITFANAVREQCERFPEFWQQGLLQMACFIGRNQRFRDLSVNREQWAVQNEEQFFSKTHEIILDSGIRAPIFVAHYLKTTVAVQAELQRAPKKTQAVLLAALNRFVQSPIKQKHSRRLANQAIALVRRDYD